MHMFGFSACIKPGEPWKISRVYTSCAQMLINFVSPFARRKCFASWEAKGDTEEFSIVIIGVFFKIFIRCICVPDKNCPCQYSS